MKVLEGGPVYVNWDPAETQRVTAGLLAKYPEIDATFHDSEEGTAAALRAFVAGGRPLTLAVTEDVNSLGWLWQELHGSNPNFNVITVSSGTWMVRRALSKALAAKAAGQPLYRLLGGKFRDRIRLYADCGDGDDSSGSPDGCAARAGRMVKEGFTALKLDIDNLRHPAKFDMANHTVNAAELRSMVERVAAVRKAIGPDVDLCIDLHARYDVPSACRIAWEMEPFNLMWLEEPIPAENVDALRQVRARSRTPICVGENLYLRWGFRELLQQQAADVIMPDVPKCGGLAESKKIVNLAEVYYLPFAPHLVSTPLGTMAIANVCAAVPNFLVLEWHALEEREIWDSYVFALDGSGSIVKDGHMALTDKPGIGLELNMENVRKHAAPGFGVFE